MTTNVHESDVLQGMAPREFESERWKAFVIADYGVGDLAFAEVSAQLMRLHGGISAEKISVPPFSTIATGFAISQMVENAFPGMVIFSNTAPRGTPEAILWQGDERQRLLFAMLKIRRDDKELRVPVFAVSSGFNWSFIKDRILQYDDGTYALYDLNIPNSGTQFRSRDIYPDAVNRILRRDTSILGAQLDPSQIPDIPLNRIAYKDGYGNIKTTTRVSQFPEHLKNSPLIKVRIGSNSEIVYNSLSKQEAGLLDFGLKAGSSGGEDDPFLEIIKRGGSADYQFGAPAIYDDRDPIEFSAVEYPVDLISA